MPASARRRAAVGKSQPWNATVDTSGSNVNLTYGGDEQIPAVALTAEGTTVWPASVAPGSKDVGSDGRLSKLIIVACSEIELAA